MLGPKTLGDGYELLEREKLVLENPCDTFTDAPGAYGFEDPRVTLEFICSLVFSPLRTNPKANALTGSSADTDIVCVNVVGVELLQYV